jgi:predicted dinucleotide-binding enzyme
VKAGVLGSGRVGQAIAGRLSELGHDVVAGTRDVEATLARTEPDAMGNRPFSAWWAEHPQVGLATFAGAAEQGEVLVNATNGAASLQALTAAGADNLAGKVLLDATNPLDFSVMPPTLNPVNSDSLGEQIQRAFPEAKVVKALNTVTAAVMIRPAMVGDGDHTVFMSGDDADAKATVAALLRDFGWRDIVDLGDITTARGTEMMIAVWLRMMQAFGTTEFGYKIVR